MSTPAETPAPAATEAARPKAERAYIPFNGQMTLHESLLFFRNAAGLKDFQESFKSLSEQFQRLRAIAQRREQALTTGEKDALAKVLEQEIKDFEGKDGLFQKVYGFRSGAIFSQNRPFYFFRTFRLLTPVTDEELAKMKQDASFKQDSIVEIDGKKHHQLSVVGGIAFDQLERYMNLIISRRDNLFQSRANLDKVPAEERSKAEAALKEAEDALAKDNEALFKTFGFTLTRNMVLDFVEAKFFVALTQEDIQKAQSGAAEAAPAAKAPEAKKDKPAAKAN